MESQALTRIERDELINQLFLGDGETVTQLVSTDRISNLIATLTILRDQAARWAKSYDLEKSENSRAYLDAVNILNANIDSIRSAADELAYGILGGHYGCTD